MNIYMGKIYKEQIVLQKNNFAVSITSMLSLFILTSSNSVAIFRETVTYSSFPLQLAVGCYGEQ